MTINQSVAINNLLNGRITTLTIAPDGTLRPDDPPQGLILSGAFNPLHAGHEGMAAAATRLTGLPVAFELAVVNADKGALEPEDIARRAAQFTGRYTLVLSRAPLFVEKAALYPGRRFVVGYDTAARLIAPRYYGGEAGMHAALEAIRAAGCSFLVAGRLVEGAFHTLADLPVPSDLADLFTPIPETLFRADISSTELRARSRSGA
ncbi:MAG: hypothetical protein ACUVS4_02545 [Chloroflexaceae bacterium]